MARVDTLEHFLTDVADAIRTKTGSSESIAASDFDTEIENIPSGGGGGTTPTYTPIEYIEFTAAEYENVKTAMGALTDAPTIFKLDASIDNYDFYIDFQVLEGSGTWKFFHGSIEKYMLNQNDSSYSVIRLYQEQPGGGNFNTTYSTNIKQRHSYQRMGSSFLVDGVSKGSASANVRQYNNYHFGLIGAPMRFYRAVLYKIPTQNEILQEMIDDVSAQVTVEAIANIIPCKDENDKICLYDAVANKLIYPQIEVNLVAGPDVS